MPPGDYRDELAAAHARIAELEEQLADARGGGAGAAPWLAELEAKRADALVERRKGLGDPRRRWKVWGILFGVLMAIAAVLALMSGSFLPFLPFFIFSLHPGLLFIWVFGKQRETKAKQEIAKIDEKIADVKRMAEMMGAARVRVDPGPSELAELDPDELHTRRRL